METESASMKIHTKSVTNLNYYPVDNEYSHFVEGKIGIEHVILEHSV